MSKLDTPLSEMSINQLRVAYRDALRGLTYDNADVAAVGRALAAKVDTTAAPIEHVRAIRALRVPCRRCCGTGLFSRTWDVTDPKNPQPVKPLGQCFRCMGSGFQTHEDGHRNRVADMHYLARGY